MQLREILKFITEEVSAEFWTDDKNNIKVRYRSRTIDLPSFYKAKEKDSRVGELISGLRKLGSRFKFPPGIPVSKVITNLLDKKNNKLDVRIKNGSVYFDKKEIKDTIFGRGISVGKPNIDNIKV